MTYFQYYLIFLNISTLIDSISTLRFIPSFKYRKQKDAQTNKFPVLPENKIFPFYNCI